MRSAFRVGFGFQNWVWLSRFGLAFRVRIGFQGWGWLSGLGVGFQGWGWLSRLGLAFGVLGLLFLRSLGLGVSGLRFWRRALGKRRPLETSTVQPRPRPKGGKSSKDPRFTPARGPKGGKDRKIHGSSPPAARAGKNCSSSGGRSKRPRFKPARGPRRKNYFGGVRLAGGGRSKHPRFKPARGPRAASGGRARATCALGTRRKGLPKGRPLLRKELPQADLVPIYEIIQSLCQDHNPSPPFGREERGWGIRSV